MAASYDNSYNPTSYQGKTSYKNYALFVSSNLLNRRYIDVVRQNCWSNLDPSLATKTIYNVSSSIPYYSNADSTYYYSSGVINLVACPDSATWKAPTVDGYTFNGWYTIPSSAMYPSSDQGQSASNYTKLITSDANTTWGVIRTGCNCWGKKTDYGSNTYDYNYKNYIMLKYTPKTLTVRYNANRGSGAPSGSYTATFDTAFTITSTKPTRSRYVFLGWSTNKNATTAEYAAGEKVLFPASLFNSQTEIVLYAVWQYGAVIAAFNPMGGNVSPRYLIVMKGSTYGSLPTPTYSGATFQGWYTAETGGTKVTSSSTVPNSDHILYAHWSGVTPTNSHLLTFDPAGGTVSTPTRTVNEGAAYGTLPTPSYSGYTFIGWFTSTVGGTQVTASTTMGTDDVIVYAQWQPANVTVTFNPNGGSVDETSRTFRSGRQLQTTPKPYWENHTFLGWFTSATGGTEVTADTVITSSRVVYAHWDNKSIDWWDVETW